MQDIVLVWSGEELQIKASNILHLVEQVEEIITLPELANATQSGKIPLARLAKAYGVTLRYAGFKVADEQVYEGMFANGDRRAVMAAINTLYSIMVPLVPPVALQEKEEGRSKKKAVVGGGSMSKRHTKPQSPSG